MDGAPWDYGMELFQEQTDRIEKELIMGFERYPAVAGCGREDLGERRLYLCAQMATRLVGPVAGKPGYWCACAVMAGFLQGGGVGKSLAEWMIHGEPEADVFGMDVARFGPFAENKQYIQRDDRTVLLPPVCDDLSQRATACRAATSNAPRPTRI